MFKNEKQFKLDSVYQYLKKQNGVFSYFFCFYFAKALKPFIFARTFKKA